MEKTVVHVFVPQSAALAQGKSSYGEATVVLDDNQVAQLSQGAREVVLTLNKLIKRLTVDVADAPHVVEALELEAQKRAEAARAETEKLEADVARALSCPDDEWLNTNGYHGDGAPYVMELPSGVYLYGAAKADARIDARREQLTRDVLPRRRAAWEQKQREGKERREREQAQKEADKRRVDELARRYVMAAVPEYARSAKEGLDVTTIARKAQIEGLARLVAEATGAPLVNSVYGETNEHKRPRQQAWDIHDAAKRFAADWLETQRRAEAITLVSELEVSIVRADTCPESGCSSGWRTCVDMVVSWIGGRSEHVYLYADHANNHVHELESDADDEDAREE